jgi:hypothetical protein
MSALRSSAVWWGYRRGPFPRPFTIYAGKVEDVSLGDGDFARALTNSERRNQRRRDRGPRGSGTGQESAGQPWGARTERRTETGSSSKDYAGAQGGGVNQRARKSVEGKELAPQEQRKYELLNGEFSRTRILQPVNQAGEFVNASVSNGQSRLGDRVAQGFPDVSQAKLPSLDVQAAAPLRSRHRAQPGQRRTSAGVERVELPARADCSRMCATPGPVRHRSLRVLRSTPSSLPFCPAAEEFHVELRAQELVILECGRSVHQRDARPDWVRFAFPVLSALN